MTPLSTLKSQIPKLKHLIISGDTQSGKTALAKTLVKHFRDLGLYPVLVRDEAISKLRQHTAVKPTLDDLLLTQYTYSNPEHIRQISRAKRVVIIDNSHRLRTTRPRGKTEIIQSICSWAEQVILFAHVFSSDIEDLLHPSSDITFARYQILPFGHRARRALIETWVSLGGTSGEEQQASIRQVAEVQRILDTLVGRNFVLPYPAYILAILQAKEAATPIDTKASTHGYFYELLIKASLARSQSGAAGYDILMTYLASLAYSLLSRSRAELTRLAWQSFHREFCEDRDLALQFEDLRSGIVSMEILHDIAGTSGVYRFKYPYQFYYFTASYIRDNLSDDRIRERVRDMCRSLHIERNANILLFLAHLSRDPFIVDCLLQQSRLMYSDHQPSDLDRDVAFLADQVSQWSESIFLQVFRECDVVDHRARALREADDASHTELIRATDQVTSNNLEFEDDLSEPGMDMTSPFARVNAALKTLQILGQTVKNFPALDRDVKASIVGESSAMALRLLSWYLKLLADNESDLIGEISRLLYRTSSARYPAPDNRLLEDAKRVILGFAMMSSFGIIKHISQSIGSVVLNLTYDRALPESSPANRLIRISLDLDHTGDFPMDRVSASSSALAHIPFAKAILCGLVTQHLYMFDVPIAIKQRVCADLDIKYIPALSANPSSRLVGRT